MNPSFTAAESRLFPNTTTGFAGGFSGALAGLASRPSPVSCRLDEATIAQVDELAKASNCSRGAVLRRLIETALLTLNVELASQEQEGEL